MPENNLFVSNEDESPRMFKSDFLDYFSRVHFSMVLIIYLPIIGWLIYLGLVIYQVNWIVFTSLFFGALIFWTLFEYLLHRYFFHLELKGKVGERVHFIVHGVHHNHPNDSKRLVMPPGASLALALVLFGIFYLSFGLNLGLTCCFAAGFTLGYVIYDMMHFATHHSNFKARWFLKIKTNHMMHHYKDHSRGFGLSNIFWDKVFGTLHDFDIDSHKNKS